MSTVSKKKSKGNAFSKFMFSYKASEETKGRTLDNATLLKKASERWQNLSDHEKPIIKAPTVEKTENKQEIMTERQLMEYSINDMLYKAMNVNGLESKFFYFISLNYYVKRSGSHIWPCELAMSEFSIKNGVTRTMHTLINPGKLPIGFAGEALIHARKTHRFDLPDDNTEGETDYSKIMKMILDFVGYRGINKAEVPPFFSGISNDEIEGAQLTLDMLRDECDYNINAFKVYPIDMLLLLLQRKCVEIQRNLHIEEHPLLISVIFARHCLETKDDFSYCQIGCELHNQIDMSSYCSLSLVKRWGYSIAKYCMDSRFKRIPGNHFPENYHISEHIEMLEETDTSSSGDHFTRVKGQASFESVTSVSRFSKSHSESEPMIATSIGTANSNSWIGKLLAGRKTNYDSSSVVQSDSESSNIGG